MEFRSQSDKRMSLEIRNSKKGVHHEKHPLWLHGCLLAMLCEVSSNVYAQQTDSEIPAAQLLQPAELVQILNTWMGTRFTRTRQCSTISASPRVACCGRGSRPESRSQPAQALCLAFLPSRQLGYLPRQ